jgi:3D (Asp-Asp-Asp) domain-containing protein
MDRGGAITTGKLDIAVATHDEALELGVIKKDVYLIEN